MHLYDMQNPGPMSMRNLVCVCHVRARFACFTLEGMPPQNLISLSLYSTYIINIYLLQREFVIFRVPHITPTCMIG